MSGWVRRRDRSQNAVNRTGAGTAQVTSRSRTPRALRPARGRDRTPRARSRAPRRAPQRDHATGSQRPAPAAAVGPPDLARGVDVGPQRLLERRGVLLRQVDLVVRAVEAEGDGAFRFSAVDVVGELDRGNCSFRHAPHVRASRNSPHRTPRIPSVTLLENCRACECGYATCIAVRLRNRNWRAPVSSERTPVGEGEYMKYCMSGAGRTRLVSIQNHQVADFR